MPRRREVRIIAFCGEEVSFKFLLFSVCIMVILCVFGKCCACVREGRERGERKGQGRKVYRLE